MILVLCTISCVQTESKKQMQDLPQEGLVQVQFRTSDPRLQALYDSAESKSKWNISQFQDYKVLVEGGGYQHVWLETQPMGGYMYAKRNLEIAGNNIKIFMDHQREDGRLPGMISNAPDSLVPRYEWFQGYFFPMPAFEMYFWLNKDREYLTQLYNTLQDFDAYLWKTRDSDNNGCLESWCSWDTGEDHSIRYGGSPNLWPYDYPPTKEFFSDLSPEELKYYFRQNSFDPAAYMPVPIESMDFMSFSYANRDVLARISKELNNDKEAYWQHKAIEVQRKLKEYLWDEEKLACYDRDASNKQMDVLLHNSLRCMYFGSFDQQMADDFVRVHLLNPDEFWTPVPLPSIAANDALFRNIAGNNWSGQPQGLTYQRSIRALENYGHYAELTLLGEKFLDLLTDSLKFTQQFHPFEKIINNSSDGYGPTILASLEFISRLYGIHYTQDKIYWSAIDRDKQIYYQQAWNKQVFEMEEVGDSMNCYINKEKVFSMSKGVRVVTDLEGKIVEVIGIDTRPKKVRIQGENVDLSLVVAPNSQYRMGENNKLEILKSVEFSLKPL
ncbi:hypothetical protein D770_23935 [Flammeovirgaceae bacterium 311]|nr:hypothetical protein D770_23935 [Flammeovirgaceae bacterium 311]